MPTLCCPDSNSCWMAATCCRSSASLGKKYPLFAHPHLWVKSSRLLSPHRSEHSQR